MDLTLLLTVIGIIVAIIIGVWQIYLAQKQISVDGKLKNLPSVEQETINQISEDASDLKSSSNRGVILWVDDDVEMMSPFMVSLESDGFVIQTASNFLKAKEILTSGQRFDLIITDLIFPYGDEKSDKDGQANYLGLEIAKLVKDLFGKIPVLCVTVVRTPAILDELHKTGVEVLAKPIRPSVLIEKVKLTLLESRLLGKHEDVLEEIKRRQIEITSDSAYIRRRAIWALGEIGYLDSAIINSLKEVGKTDKDPSVREAAKEAVSKIQRQLKKPNSKRRRSL